MGCKAPVGGGKATVAKRVWDVTVAGDLDSVPLEAVFAEPEAPRKLALYAALCRELYQRLGPLARALRTGAAAGDSELPQLLDTVERERLIGTASIAAHLSAVDALRLGLTVERAGERLWAINAPETGDALVLRCGWSLDEYQIWMTELFTSASRIPQGTCNRPNCRHTLRTYKRQRGRERRPAPGEAPLVGYLAK